MLSRRELERAARLLDAALAGGHLDRIVQRDDTTLELVASRRAGERRRFLLVLSCDPRHARVGEAEAFAPAPKSPLPFAQLLRARAGRARILGVDLEPGERQLSLRLGPREGAATLVLQILGPRSNLYLLDAEGRIAGSLRPLGATRRDLAPGAALVMPDTPPPPPGEDRFAAVPDAAFLRAVESHYTARAREEAAEALARRVARALHRERQRLVRREAALRRDLATARPSHELRRLGELVKGALHRLHPGADAVTLRDPVSGQDVVVPLDPALGPTQNLERIFSGYRRARRREEALAVQQAELEAQIAALGRLRGALDALAGSDVDPQALARFAARREVERLLARHPPPGAGRPPRTQPARSKGGTPARLRPARYRTGDGLEIWLGRSAEGNDHLTTRLARGGDLFLHVEGGPGSHVVLRLAGRREAPQESLLEAAELAVHFSKQRHAARATLHVAPIRDVRKPRGAKPGLVHVHGGRTLALRRDAARLARVLGARIADPD